MYIFIVQPILSSNKPILGLFISEIKRPSCDIFGALFNICNHKWCLLNVFCMDSYAWYHFSFMYYDEKFHIKRETLQKMKLGHTWLALLQPIFSSQFLCSFFQLWHLNSLFLITPFFVVFLIKVIKHACTHSNRQNEMTE